MPWERWDFLENRRKKMNLTDNDEEKNTPATFLNGDNDTSKYIASSYENIKTDLIKITRDKLEIILLKYLDASTKRTSWITPISLFFTFLIALITTDFKTDLPFISADTLNAIFIILCIASLIWAITEVYFNIKRGKKQTIDNLIDRIANNEN